MRWFPSDRTNGRVDVCCLYRWGPCRPDPGSRHHTPRKLRGAERPDLSIERINQRNVCFGSAAVQKTRLPGPVSGLKRPFSSVGTGPPIPHDSRGFHPPLFSLCPFMLRKKGRSFGPSRATPKRWPDAGKWELLLDVRLQEPQGLVQAAGDLGEDIGGIRVAGFG
jgi:hypothetical protein